jgi:predicted peptidase
MLLVTLALLAQLTTPVRFHVTPASFDVPAGGTLRYAVAVPNGVDRQRPRPLVLALHPGGGAGIPYYGMQFMQQIVLPALAKTDLQPVVVAPDCPTRSWGEPASDRAVMALLKHVGDQYAIDPRRVLVTGFSMGGHGTWFFEAHHPEFFTGAIVMAGATGDEPQEGLARIPTYVIHGTRDRVVPFGPAERNARELEKLGRPVTFEAVEGAEHYSMGNYIEPFARAARWMIEQWERASH